jgi:hypothetical protein
VSDLIGRDLYVKITDKTGKSHLACHNVWDGVRFFQSLTEQHKKEGGAVALSTREEYLAERKKERQAS